MKANQIKRIEWTHSRHIHSSKEEQPIVAGAAGVGVIEQVAAGGGIDSFLSQSF